MTILEVKSLKKIYTTRFGGNQVQALSNVSFSVEQGEYAAIMGESGSGKTTRLFLGLLLSVVFLFAAIYILIYRLTARVYYRVVR